MKILIDLDVTPEDFKRIQVFNIKMMNNKITHKVYEAVQKGTPLPKHGKLVDISKIDEDRIESDNPVIYLTINGEYIEAVSLDYLNSLPPIIEADMRKEGDEE